MIWDDDESAPFGGSLDVYADGVSCLSRRIRQS